MEMIANVFRRLTQVMMLLATAFLLVMTALVIIAAVMRYVVGAPFRFTEELVALLYMAMVFLAIPIATLEKRHVSIDILPAAVSRVMARPLAMLAALVTVIFAVWFTIDSLAFVEQSVRFSSRTEQTDILLWPWMALIPLTMGFVALISCLHLVQIARDKARPSDSQPIGDGL